MPSLLDFMGSVGGVVGGIALGGAEALNMPESDSLTTLKSSVILVPITNGLEGNPIKLQFDPQYTETYSNNIGQFSPILGDVSYPIFTSRGEDKYSLECVYYARTVKEAEQMEDLVETIRQIATPKDGSLPVVYVCFPFKNDRLKVQVENVRIEYAQDYIKQVTQRSSTMLGSALQGAGYSMLGNIASGGYSLGSNKDLPRKVSISFSFVKYVELPSITSLPLAGIISPTNYDVSNARTNVSQKGKSKGQRVDSEQDYLDTLSSMQEGEGSPPFQVLP